MDLNQSNTWIQIPNNTLVGLWVVCSHIVLPYSPPHFDNNVGFACIYTNLVFLNHTFQTDWKSINFPCFTSEECDVIPYLIHCLYFKSRDAGLKSGSYAGHLNIFISFWIWNVFTKSSHMFNEKHTHWLRKSSKSLITEGQLAGSWLHIQGYTKELMVLIGLLNKNPSFFYIMSASLAKTTNAYEHSF